jgi:hypothetical protein
MRRQYSVLIVVIDSIVDAVVRFALRLKHLQAIHAAAMVVSQAIHMSFSRGHAFKVPDERF